MPSLRFARKPEQQRTYTCNSAPQGNLSPDRDSQPPARPFSPHSLKESAEEGWRSAPPVTVNSSLLNLSSPSCRQSETQKLRPQSWRHLWPHVQFAVP